MIVRTGLNITVGMQRAGIRAAASGEDIECRGF